ncbi:MAG: glycosyltransferase family 39 protein [Peptococcaceae bacterium]|nr:glycosyltransferase family 39 protein [Peptococcaceae bacterium]
MSKEAGMKQFISKFIERKNGHVDIFLGIVLSVFLCLQAAVIFMYGENYYLGDFETMSNDDVKYVRSGQKLIEDFELYYSDADFALGVPSVFIMPGYPLFLAVFLKVFGHFGLAGGLLAVRLAQGLLQTGVIVLLYRMGKKHFSMGVARVVILIYVLYVPNLEVPLLILTETVFTFLFVLLLYVCFEAVKTKRMKYYVGGGVVLGLAVMVRPTVLLFPVVILVIWLLKKVTLREMLKYTLVVGGILAAIMAPWWIRNAMEFNRFIPLTLSSGNPFMQGAFIDYDFSEKELYFAELPADTDSSVVDQAEMDAGKKRLWDSWQEKPLETIRWYTWGKFKELWYFPFYRVVRETVPVPFHTVNIYHFLLLALAALGGVMNCLKGESNRRLKLLLPISGIVMCVVYLPYFTCSRYFYPLMPIVFLLAACGICSVARRLKQLYDKILRSDRPYVPG